jgi:lipoyl(octanoyl) transferase
MIHKIDFEDLGLMDYRKAWTYQEELFNQRVHQKLEKRKSPTLVSEDLNDILLFVEHPHVYTLGKSGERSNLLITDQFLEKINASYYHIDRGGDITYHGPGQLVGYPIFDLEHFGIHLKQYVYGLEQSIINFLLDLGIKSERLEGATGVWIEPGTKQARKICAIGVKGSRHITMHGFAFNVNTDLDYFGYINPCGFTDKGVTSLKQELGSHQNFEQIKLGLQVKIVEYFESLA